MDVKKVFPVSCSLFPVCFSRCAVRVSAFSHNGNLDAKKGVVKWK